MAHTLLKSTRACSGQEAWCAWLSWDDVAGETKYLNTVVKSLSAGAAVPWRVQAVASKPGVYTIKGRWKCPIGDWCNAGLSWNEGTGRALEEHGHPMAAVRKNDPVKWRLEAVAGKTDKHTIKSTWRCPDNEWCNATLSLDYGFPHLQVSPEKTEQVEWRFYDYQAVEDEIIKSIIEYKVDRELAEGSCAHCNGKNYAKLTVVAYKNRNLPPVYAIDTWFATRQHGPTSNGIPNQGKVEFSTYVNRLYQLDPQAIQRLTLCILTKGAWPQQIWNGTNCE